MIWRAFLETACIVFVMAVLGAVTLFSWAYSLYERPGPLEHTRYLVIQRGQNLGEIARDMAMNGIINNPRLFQEMAQHKGYDLFIRAGEYKFPPRVSMETVLDMLSKGKTHQRYVTVPEGLTSWQIVQLLNQTKGMIGTLTEVPPEGSLMPDTYSYVLGDPRLDKIGRMQMAMNDAMAELWPKRAKNLPFTTPLEALTLASIIEKETGVPEERRRVAGVFINRLEYGVPLQADSTVIYAITGGKIQNKGLGPLGRRMTRKDWQYPSTYNTYRVRGLPPGPICNPGRASIAAALNPERHSYLYFVADGTGGHAFARTLDEHNKNVARWRRIRAGQASPE